jgi:hypothetical protein
VTIICRAGNWHNAADGSEIAPYLYISYAGGAGGHGYVYAAEVTSTGRTTDTNAPIELDQIRPC